MDVLPTTSPVALPNHVLQLVAGMFNAAPNAAYLKEFETAFTALGGDYSALAQGLGATATFARLYPASMSADAAINQFLDGLQLRDNAEAQAWMHAQVGTGKTAAQIMVQALAALVESTDPAFADAQKLLANKAAVAGYYALQMKGDSEDFAYLQSVLSKVEAGSDVSTPQALAALVAAGTGDTDPGTDPGDPDPGDPDPGDPDPGVQTVVIATAANQSTALLDLADGKLVRVSGENQTIGTANNADQTFDRISVLAAKGPVLQLTLDNTARVDAQLRIHQLVIADNPQDAADASAVRTLQLVSGGTRDTHNYINEIDAARVSRFELSGSQRLDISLNHAANADGPGQGVTALTVDGSAMTGALHVWMESTLANKVDANQTATFMAGQSSGDELEFSAGLATTAHTRVAGFETVAFHGGRFDATNATGVQLYKSNGAALQLSHLKAVENVQLGGYDAAAQTGSNPGGEQQFVTSQLGAGSTLNITAKSAAAGVQLIDTSGYATLNLKLDTAAVQPVAQKQFQLDLGKTAVDAQLNPLAPDLADYALASAVPLHHWTRTQLEKLVVTGGTGVLNGAVGDQLDLTSSALPSTIDTFDFSGYRGVVLATLGDPWISQIEGQAFNSGNTLVKVGAYGMAISDATHAAGLETVTTFEFTADALQDASAAGSSFVWNISHFKAFGAAGGSLGNLTVLDLAGVGVHDLGDMQLSQAGANVEITGVHGQHFKIVLAGVTATELGVENFKFATP